MELYTAGYWMAFLIIGGAIGWVAGLFTDGCGFGLIADIVSGICGAPLGGWLGMLIGRFTGSSAGVFLLALVGAVVLVGLTRYAKQPAV